MLVFAACFVALALPVAAFFFGLDFFVADFFRLTVRALFDRADFLAERVEAFFFFAFFLAGMRQVYHYGDGAEDLCRNGNGTI